MARLKWDPEPCYICGGKQPLIGTYHEFPWHLTCAYDEAGQKKIAVWKREQKNLAKAAIPTLLS
jgi:hypothetical protein